MPKYKISSGAIYDIPEEKVQDFLFKYPDAVLVEEQGKEKGPVTEAAVAGPETQVGQPAADTASVLEDTSLDLPPTETFSIDGKEVTKKEFDKYTALQEAAKITNETDTEDPSIWDKIGYELFKAKEYSLNALEDLPERAKKVFLETKAVANDFIKNTAGEDAADFFFGENVPEGQIAFIDPETNKEVLYSENPNKWKELANLNARTDTYVKSVYSGTDVELGEAADKKYIEVMNQAKKLGEEMQTTGGGMVAGFKGLAGVEGYEEYGAADVLGGGFSAVLSVLETAVPAVLTRGASVFPQIAAPMFADYNRTKAETLYAGADNALDLLVENNEVEFTTPLLLSTVAVQAERLGLKGLSKYIMKAPLASKSVLNIARLSTISSGEGMVEVAQGMTDAINTSIAEGKSTEQVSEQVIKYLGSDQALDDFLGGFVGQAGAGAGGRTINRVLRGGNQGRAKVNTLLTDLNNLKAAAKQTKNKISKNIIQENIAQKEAELKKYLEENNKIAQQLTDVEKQELLGLLETKDVLYSQAFDLKTQKSEGKISNKDYGYAIRSINSQANKADIRIDEIRQDAAKREIEKITEKVAEVSKKIGGKAPMIFETTEEYVKAVAEDQNIDLQKAKSIVGGTEGVFAGESKIFIDKQQAAKVGNIGVAAHEFLHPVLNALVGDVNQQQEIVKEFENSLSKAQRNKMNVLLSAYADKNGVLDPKVKASEYLTVFSNAIINGDIQYEQGVFEKIGDYIRQLLGKYGFTNANFESGKGVYNFLKEYNKTIQKEGGLSERALELIKKREAETGVKVAEVGTLEGVQASKKLSPEISAQVGEQITEIKNLQKEGEALAERFNKEFIKSPKQTRIEQQLSENIAPALDALAESTTKRLYDPIAPEAKRNVSRQDYKDALKANWTSMVINEFNPAKQDVETFLSTRGNLRANSLAKELGIEGIAEGGIKADVTEQKALTTEDQTDTGIDEGIDIARREAKLINPVNLIQDENLRKKYINAVKAKLKDLNVKGLSFKTLKDLAPEVTAQLFNIPVKKVTDAAANLSTGDLSTIQNFINKNADLLLKLLPEGGIDQNQAASEKLLGTSTGVPKKLLDAFYDPKPRGTKGAGLAIQNKRKGITRKEFLETFGIVDGKKLEGLSPRGPEAQAMKGLVSLFGRMMTNTVVRQELSKKKDQQLVYNASPKSFEQLGERTGLIFLATDKREAKAYAEMNRGEVKDIYINKPEIATEKEAIAVMKELGIDTTEGNLYELIDPRFEDFYIGKEAMDQVTSALADKGFKAIRYEDGGQVSKTTESIVVFDKSAISQTEAKGIETDIQDIAAGKSALQASRTLSGEMSSEKGNIFWNKQNKNSFKELIKNDPENIGEHFKEVYGGVFSNEDKIIKELKAEYKNWQKLPEENRNVFEEHIIEHIASFGFRSELRNLLGLGKNSLNFRNKKQIESARKALVELTKQLTEEDFMQYLLPTLQAGWGLIGGKYVVSKNSDGYILQEINEDGTQNIRYHLISGRKDAINVLLNGVFENETSYNPEVSNREAIINGKKITTTVVPTQNANDFASGKFEKDLQKRKDFAKDQRDGMLKIATALQSLIAEGKINNNDVGMILMTFNSNPNALIRTAAIPENKFDGQFSENTEFVYEHSKPAREVLVQLAELISKNKLDKKSYANIMKDYIVTILPKAYDTILNKYYKDFSPVDKNGNYLKSSSTRPARYFNNIVKAAFAAAGLPPLKLIPLGQKPKRKVVLQPSRGQQSQREKTLDKQFNDILENKTGIASDKEYSEAKAKVVGANKGKFNWFIPPTAEDFVGLLYQFLSKGPLGDKQMAWFKVNLLDPYAKAMSAVSRDRNTLARNYRALKKELKIVPKNLKKEVPGEGFTVEQAVRVYIWTKQGYDIPGLSDADAKPLREYINSKPELKEFADKLILLNKNEYAKPKEGWDAGTITTDMLAALNENVRAAHLQEWQENVDVIFSEKNLNKIEAAYGPKFRYALENILTRMKTGRNRTYGTDSLTGRLTDWLTNSIGAIMFFNTRSAILQTISSVNFINFTDNNPIAAAKAFANTKQYWSDFLKLYNSDFLVDRRDGLRLNVNESDIADMAKQGGVKGIISELLKLGFTPTQIADSFAIASGGATFYRNRLKTYLKEGMDEKTAEEKAFQDFRETAEESQQSSRPDKISQQQAGPLGRIILAFANTPAQYARLMKKAYLDLKDGRGDAKTNISKLIYYGAIQNLVFTAMQQALFGIMFGDEEDEDEDKTKKAINVANGMADSILRGMGISGAIVSVLKNTVKKLIERSEKKSPNYAENAVAELLKISPPISSKASKIKNALRSYEWDKDEMYEKGLALDNPAYLAAGNIVSAATNVPLDRAVKKVTNVKDAMDEDIQLWQRIALLGGWSEWELGIKEEDKKSKSLKPKRTKSLLETKRKRNLLRKK